MIKDHSFVNQKGMKINTRLHSLPACDVKSPRFLTLQWSFFMGLQILSHNRHDKSPPKDTGAVIIDNLTLGHHSIWRHIGSATVKQALAQRSPSRPHTSIAPRLRFLLISISSGHDSRCCGWGEGFLSCCSRVHVYLGGNQRSLTRVRQLGLGDFSLAATNAALDCRVRWQLG